MRRDSTVRLAATLLSYLAGAIAAVITARWLGPSGKGVVALIALLSGLLTRFAVISLGEAAVVLVGKGNVPRDRAVGMVVATIGATSVGAAVVFIGITFLLVDPTDSSTWLAILFGAISIPILAFSDALSQFLLFEKRVIRSSVVFATGSVVTLLAVGVLLIGFDLGIAGAVAGTAIGGLASVAVAVQAELLSPPRFDRSVLRQALSYGIPAESGVLLTQAAARIDLLLVFAISGSSAAGVYSVALTIGSLVNLAPSAIAFAAFPRLAQRPSGTEATATVARLTRLAAASAVISGVAFAAFSAVAIGPLFGDEFDSALGPALILIAAGIPWGMQWTVARGIAALGSPALLFRSFGVTVVAMVLLDLALIPLFDLTGAAIGSAAATCLGLAVCFRHIRHEGISLTEMMPRISEVAALRHPAGVAGDPVPPAPND